MGRTKAEALAWVARVAPVRIARARERPRVAGTFVVAVEGELEEAERMGWMDTVGAELLALHARLRDLALRQARTVVVREKKTGDGSTYEERLRRRLLGDT